MEKNKNSIIVGVLFVVILAVIGASVFVYMDGKDSSKKMTGNFEECVAAGNPVMESYPRQCRDKVDNLFVEEEGIFCTMDAMECLDGSFVGRIAPSCEFAECPGN